MECRLFLDIIDVSEHIDSDGRLVMLKELKVVAICAQLRCRGKVKLIMIRSETKAT